MTPELLIALGSARASSRAVCLLSSKNVGALRLIDPSDMGQEPGDIQSSARAALKTDQFQTLQSGQDLLYIAPFSPPVRIFIIGAVHIAQALLPILDEIGYESLVIDPRSAFASDARFSSATVINDWPDDALAAQTIHARSAIVTLTHDPKLDDPALTAALTSDAFYIGALGSKRTHAKRLERLEAAGFTADQVARIAAPVGLNIGAQSPAEIAVSIAAQIIEALRGPKP